MYNEREVNEARRDNRVLTVDANRHQEIQVVDWVICSAPQNENQNRISEILMITPLSPLNPPTLLPTSLGILLNKSITPDFRGLTTLAKDFILTDLNLEFIEVNLLIGQETD